MQHSTSGTRPSVVAPGARLEKLAGGFDFTEGPTSDAEGNVFFTDQPNNRIVKWSADGKFSTSCSQRAAPTACISTPAAISSPARTKRTSCGPLRPTARSRCSSSEYGGKLLNGPNDVWVRPDGALYFTDPFYKRDWWKRDNAMPQDGATRLLPVAPIEDG